VDSLLRADANLEQLSKQVVELRGRGHRDAATDISISTSELSTKISLLMDNIEAQSQRIPAHQSPQIHSSARTTHEDVGRNERQEVDRAHNIVVTGNTRGQESKRMAFGNNQRILHVVEGRDIQIADAFRLGCFTTDRIRPIVVKLHSTWDKRTVLSNTHALTDHATKRRSVYISGDEPVDVRCKWRLKSLHRRARWQGHSAEISTDGSKLSADGVIFVFVERRSCCRCC
jgi:hypothetical protein